MSDLIRVVDLEIWTTVGVPEEERAHGQKLLITLDLHCGNLAEAAAEDDISLTVDYFIVAQRVKALAYEHTSKLIEKLAEDIAADLLATFPLTHIEIELKKFILPDAQYVSVKIRRYRP